MEHRRVGFHRTPAGGFTLMEILTVISIISLMMSITLPALTGAREQGKRVVCLSNMRNLTQSWMTYALENDDKLCSADTGWDVPPANHWVADGPILPGNEIGGTEQAIRNGVLWPYAGKMLDLYKCESDASPRLRSYAISRAMNGRTWVYEDDRVKPFRLWSEITQASRRLVFIDANCRTRWMEGSFCSVEGIRTNAPRWFVRNSRNITARHSGGCNLTFADGHCEYWKYSDPRTISVANYAIDPEEASDYNPDLDRMIELLKGKRE